MDTAVIDRAAERSRQSAVRTIVTVGILAVLVLAGLVLGNVVEARAHRAPYTAAEIGASVRMEIVAPGRVQAVVDQLAGPGRLNAPLVEPVAGQPTQQQLVGQLSFRTPRNAPSGGQYGLFVIDRASNKPVPAIYGVGPAGTNVVQGWDGRFNKVAAKYPWLHMLASVRVPNGFTDPGMAVIFASDTPGPVTFTALLDQDSLPVTDPPRQLTVALVFIGADDHIYWATKLAG